MGSALAEQKRSGGAWRAALRILLLKRDPLTERLFFFVVRLWPTEEVSLKPDSIKRKLISGSAGSTSIDLQDPAQS